jgi:hypothetical protein
MEAHQAGGFITYDRTNKTFQTPSEGGARGGCL